MKIEIRENARKELSNVDIHEGEGIRLSLKELEGACSVGIDIELYVEKKREGDLEFIENEVHFFVSEQLAKSLPDTIIIDFAEGKGFKIFSNDEMLGFFIHLKYKG